MKFTVLWATGADTALIKLMFEGPRRNLIAPAADRIERTLKAGIPRESEPVDPKDPAGEHLYYDYPLSISFREQRDHPNSFREQRDHSIPIMMISTVEYCASPEEFEASKTTKRNKALASGQLVRFFRRVKRKLVG